MVSIMRKSALVWGLALAAAAGGLLAFAPGSSPQLARADVPAAQPVDAPDVIVLSGVPGASSTDVLRVTPGSAGPPTRLGTVEHREDAVVRGAVVPGSGIVLVVADTHPARDLSWAASLIAVAPGAAARELCDRVYHATRPLVTASGRVFVQRGREGAAAPLSGGKALYRVDPLSIDEVDPASGAKRVVYQWTGFETHLAGELDGELIVYRVGPQGADLVGVQPDSGQVRVIVPSWPAFARDFSIDTAGRALVVQQLDPGGSRGWVAEQVDLHSGAVRALTAPQKLDLMPHAWPGGAVLVHAGADRASVVLGPSSSVRSRVAGGPLWIRSQSIDGAWLAGLRMIPGRLPEAVVVRAGDTRVVQLPRSERARVDIAGFAGGAR